MAKTGRSDAERCLRCGGTNLELGKITDAGLQLANAKFLSISAVMLASVCLDCGRVELSVDVEKVSKKLKRRA